MNLCSFEEFETVARTEGFDEVLRREWAPDQVLPKHSHPFAVKALVVAGEVWLDCDGDGAPRHLRAGDTFELAPDRPHAERYGPEGAQFWVARRHAA